MVTASETLAEAYAEEVREDRGRLRRADMLFGRALPKPLTPTEEAEAIAALDGEGREAARALLIEHNLRLVVSVTRKYRNAGEEPEDLASVGVLGLMRAIDTYRADSDIKLSTYAVRCMQIQILNHLREMRRIKNALEVSLDAPLTGDWNGGEASLYEALASDDEDVSYNLEREAERKIILEEVANLDERNREIITMRYGLDGTPAMTIRQVAAAMGISSTRVGQLELKIRARLKSRLRRKL